MRRIVRCRGLVVAIIALTSALFSPPAWGDTTPTEGGWRVEFTPILWAPSLDAKTTVGGFSSDVDLSFSDIVDHADEVFGLSGRLETRKGPWGLFVETIFIAVTANFTVGPVSTELENDFGIYHFGANYRLVEKPLPGAMRLLFDLSGGIRHTYLKQLVSATGSPPFTTSLGGSEDWYEPVIGAAGVLYLTERLLIGLRGDAGGFGIGEAAKLSWFLTAGLGYHVSPGAVLKGGYQVYGLDFKGGGTNTIGFDGNLHGPILGVTFIF